MSLIPIADARLFDNTYMTTFWTFNSICTRCANLPVADLLFMLFAICRNLFVLASAVWMWWQLIFVCVCVYMFACVSELYSQIMYSILFFMIHKLYSLSASAVTVWIASFKTYWFSLSLFCNTISRRKDSTQSQLDVWAQTGQRRGWNKLIRIVHCT